MTTAGRLGTAVQIVEKDFWVCRTLDALFNGLPPGAPRLLFKGGTSLSKSFGLIDRFSEDIDITVFRHDLGEAASVGELEALSGKKRRAGLDAIKAPCQAFIAGPLPADIAALAGDPMNSAQIGGDRYRVELDAAATLDEDGSRTLQVGRVSALRHARLPRQTFKNLSS